MSLWTVRWWSRDTCGVAAAAVVVRGRDAGEWLGGAAGWSSESRCSQIRALDCGGRAAGFQAGRWTSTDVANSSQLLCMAVVREGSVVRSRGAGRCHPLRRRGLHCVRVEGTALTGE